MTEKKKVGLLKKIFGGSSKSNCCSIELEEIPRTKPEEAKDTEQMKKVSTTYLLKHTLDEAPEAYKNIDEILKSLLEFNLIEPISKSVALGSYKK